MAAQRFGGADLVAKMNSDTKICPPSLLALITLAVTVGEAGVYMGSVT